MIFEHKYFVLFVFVLLGIVSITAQSLPTLTLNEAIGIGIAENLNIKAFEQQENIARLNTGKGAAGLLPTVTANGNVSYNLSNTRQQFLDGRENTIPYGTAFRANANATMDWTLYNGGSLNTRFEILQQEYELASLEIKNQVQAVSANIASTYQDLILQRKLIRILDENIVYLEDLVQLAEAKLEIGSVSKLDVLQAKTDLNEVKSSKELATMNYHIATARLNQDLNRDASSSFLVDTTFLLPNNALDYDVWVEKAVTENYEVMIARKNHVLALQEVKLADAAYMPRLDLNAGLDVGYLNSTFGFLISNRSLGPFVGLSASYNIFDGQRVQRNLQIAEVNAKLADLTISRVSLEARNELFIQFQQYKYFEVQANLERQNLTLADENFKLGQALYRNGGITQYDLRQIRIQKLAIERRLINAEHQMARAYVALLQVTGEDYLPF